MTKLTYEEVKALPPHAFLKVEFYSGGQLKKRYRVSGIQTASSEIVETLIQHLRRKTHPKYYRVA